jgi:hypothetical protein
VRASGVLSKLGRAVALPMLQAVIGSDRAHDVRGARLGEAIPLWTTLEANEVPGELGDECYRFQPSRASPSSMIQAACK